MGWGIHYGDNGGWGTGIFDADVLYSGLAGDPATVRLTVSPHRDVYGNPYSSIEPFTLRIETIDGFGSEHLARPGLDYRVRQKKVFVDSYRSYDVVIGTLPNGFWETEDRIVRLHFIGATGNGLAGSDEHWNDTFEYVEFTIRGGDTGRKIRHSDAKFLFEDTSLLGSLERKALLKAAKLQLKDDSKHSSALAWSEVSEILYEKFRKKFGAAKVSEEDNWKIYDKLIMIGVRG